VADPAAVSITSRKKKMTKATHDCPLCHGAGKVSAKIADSKITVRDREKYNLSMRLVNKNARDRKKVLATV
jgi:hypothetical protein